MDPIRINGKKYLIYPKTINAQNLKLDDILVSPNGSRYGLSKVKVKYQKDKDGNKDYTKGIVRIKGSDLDTGRAVKWTLRDGDSASIINTNTLEGLERKPRISSAALLGAAGAAGTAAWLLRAYKKTKRELAEEEDRQRSLEIARSSNRPAVTTSAVSTAYRLPTNVGFKSLAPSSLYPNREDTRAALGLANIGMSEDTNMSENPLLTARMTLAAKYRQLKNKKRSQKFKE